MRISGKAGAWVVLVGMAACSSRVDVLKEGGDGADGWDSGIDCIPEKLATRKAGSHCNFVGACWTNGECGIETYNCHSDVLVKGTKELLDCQNDAPASMQPVGWTTCADALAEGHSGDSCIGQWSCAVNDYDPCCVDLGYCQPWVAPQPQNVFQKVRYCQEECGSIPVGTDPAIDGCAPMSNTFNLPCSGTPCTGNFVCLGSDDVTNATTLNEIIGSPFDLPYWCRDGVVQSLDQCKK